MTTKRSRHLRRTVAQTGHHGLAILIAAIFVVPLVWVVAASLRQPGLPPPRTIEWLPEPVAWDNYTRIFEMVPLGQFVLNSLVVVALALPITLLTASWAGFAISQMRTQTRRRFVGLTFGLLLVPSTALWLTRYLVLKHLFVIDTLWALILPALMGSSPLFILLFYWTFRAIPRELFEAAKLDGAGMFYCWARIAMPLSRPTIMAVSVLTFTFYWSDFITPLLYLKSERNYTLALGIRRLQLLDKTNWPLLLAGGVVMTGPVIVLFLVVQRYFWPEGRNSGVSGH